MTLFLVYTLLMIYSARIGFYETYNLEDFFVAGRSLNIFYSTATFVATWFSAASILGLGGSLYIYGLSSVIYSIIPWFTGALFLITISQPLREKFNIYTYPEFFLLRYNSKIMQILSAFIMIISYIFYITMQIKGFGLAMSILLNIPYLAAIFLLYLYILYTTFGGLYSVVKTDTINAIIIFISFSIFGIFLIVKAGGIPNILSKAQTINTFPIKGWDIKTPPGGLLDIFCKGLQPPLYLFTSFFGWGLGLAANPQYVVRILSAKNAKTSRMMILCSLLLLAIIYTFIVLGSLGLRILIPTSNPVKNIDELIPTLIGILSPPFLTGIILVGIISASVSTANSELLLIANSFTYDILKNFKPNMNDEELINLNRIIIAIAGTLSLSLSLNPPESLIEFGGNIWGIFSSSSFVPLYAGVLVKNPTKKAAEASFICGLVTYLLFFLLQKYILFFPGSKNIHPGLPGFVVSLIVFCVTDWRSKYADSKH